MRIPFLLLSFETMESIGRRFKGLGRILSRVQPNLGEVLSKIGVDIEPEDYAVGSLFSAFLYGILFFAVGMAALSMRGAEPLSTSVAIGISFWLVFFLLHMIYPAIVMKKIAVKESKDLLFALREIMMDVNSGVPLFDSMKNVASEDYGYVSMEFEWAVKQIEGGVPQRTALKNLALKTESEFMKRALWQIVNAIESGSSRISSLPSKRNFAVSFNLLKTIR